MAVAGADCESVDGGVDEGNAWVLLGAAWGAEAPEPETTCAQPLSVRAAAASATRTRRPPMAAILARPRSVPGSTHADADVAASYPPVGFIGGGGFM